MKQEGLSGAEPAEIAAHRTRETKQHLTPEEMLARHRKLAALFGNQAEQVVSEARQRVLAHAIDIDNDEEGRKQAQQAVTYARDKQIEREAAFEERDLLSDALKRAVGRANLEEIRENLEARQRTGEFIKRGLAGAGRSYTTQRMLELEQGNIARMKAGRSRFREPLASEQLGEALSARLGQLSGDQRRAVLEILGSYDQIVGFQGAAGTGKTTALRVIRSAAERQGYQVEGFAPTSRAAKQLEEAGIPSRTLQHYLAQGERKEDGLRRVYFLDESSLASTRQVNELLRRLEAQDRVIFVGDVHQHQGVEAGRPFEQLQEAGMLTAQLNRIVRQRDPGLKQAVERLAQGRVREAIKGLAESGRVHVIQDPEARMQAIAREYTAQPQGTLVVSPDNRSRMALNDRIHHELQATGNVSRKEYHVKVLVPDNYLTGADREWAGRYESGHVVRFTKGSKSLRLKAGEYVRVMDSDPGTNLVTIKRRNGKTVNYDPRRLQGVSVYQEAERSFSVGDRIQFTAPYREHRIANRQLGTIKEIHSNGKLMIELDSGRKVEFSLRGHLHLDYGYAVTSHSSQGVTSDRVLVNVDTSDAHEKLLNSRFAYVAVSRARDEARIYTNNAQAIGHELSRHVTKRAAIENRQEQQQDQAQRKQRSQEQS